MVSEAAGASGCAALPHAVMLATTIVMASKELRILFFILTSLSLVPQTLRLVCYEYSL